MSWASPHGVAQADALIGRWGQALASLVEARRLTQSRLTWVMHCGGSQGLEAAVILQVGGGGCLLISYRRGELLLLLRVPP